MNTTREELDNFQLYANTRLSGAGSDLSFDELLWEWADIRDRPLIHVAIRRGLADIESGRHEPADVAMDKIRSELGIPRE